MATVVYERIATLLSERSGQSYSRGTSLAEVQVNFFYCAQQ